MKKQSLFHKYGHLIWLLLALVLVGVFMALLLHSAAFKNFVDESVYWAERVMDAHPIMGAAVFFMISALSAMLAFASTTVLVPPANLAWGKPITFLLLWGGWVAGAIAAFGMGNLARPLLIRFGYKETLEKYQHFVSKRMKFWAVLLFCFAVPSEVPGYLFGSAHYSFLKFLAAIAIAESVYALGLVIAGDSLIDAEPIPLFAAAGIFVVIAAGAGYLLRSRRKRSATARH